MTIASFSEEAKISGNAQRGVLRSPRFEKRIEVDLLGPTELLSILSRLHRQFSIQLRQAERQQAHVGENFVAEIIHHCA